jgi:tubulin--tyrosine ligase
MISAYVSWPAAPLTDSLVRSALHGLSAPVTFVNREDLDDAQKPLQWSTYDEVDHELTLVKRDTLLSSTYTFRKALIRKHFLSRIIRSYLTKKPKSILCWACPRTFELEISFADELDEMWADELWELGSELEANSSWWILKP